MVCGETGTSARDRIPTIQHSAPPPEYNFRRKMNQNYDNFKICSFQNCYYLVSIINRRVLGNSSTSPSTSTSSSSSLPYLSVFVKLLFSKLFIWFALSFFLSNLYSVSGEATQLHDANKVYEMDSTSSINSKSSNSSCPHCQYSRELIRMYILEEIKQNILIKLGFTQGAPNITISKSQSHENPFVKHLMSNLYHAGDKHHGRHKNYIPTIQNDEIQKMDDDEDKMKAQVLLAMAKPCLVETYCKKQKGHSPLTFLFEPKIAQSKLLSAKLSFFQKAQNRFLENDSRINITIYKFNPRSSGADPYSIALSIEESLNVSSRWIEIDIKDQLLKHFKEYDVTNMTLIIHAVFVNKNITAKVPVITNIKKITTDEDSQLIPYIYLRIEEQKSRRNKRSTAGNCRNEEPEESCCRYPLTVNFEHFKWDFVIAPKEYDAYYCAGECGYLANQKYTHTHLINMLPLDNKRPGPCCGPRKMGPISMLYYNNNQNVIFGIVPGMVVERCGCT